MILIAIAMGIGFIDDATGHKEYYYGNRIVVVYGKYQCPVYCGVKHNHYVYFTSETNGMVIDENLLGKRIPKKKKKKR